MYSRGSCVSYTPLAEKNSHPTRAFGHTYALVAFQLSSVRVLVLPRGLPIQKAYSSRMIDSPQIY